MHSCLSTGLQALRKFCKWKVLSLTMIVLATQVSCTKVNKCRFLRKGAWECEGNHFVPKFPLDTTTITWTDLQCSHFDNKTFQNLTELPLLRFIIRTSSISNSSTDVFHNLKYLERFEMVNCKIKLEELRKLFLGLPSGVITIHLFGFNLQHMNKDLFEGFRRTNISKIAIYKCHMPPFNGDYFTGINNLEVLDIQRNDITSITSWGYLPNLKYLDLFRNRILHFPPFKNATGFCSYPKLEKLFMAFSNYKFLDTHFFWGLDMLRTIGIDIGDIIIFRQNVFQEMKYLRAISISSLNHNNIRFEHNVLKIPTLESFALKNLHVVFNNVNKSASLFPSCEKLENLILRNITTSIDLNIILKPLTKLGNLEISDVPIYDVPDAVCNMNTLRNLTIRYTRLEKWNKVNCSAMTSLRTLVLIGNSIGVVNETLFSKQLFRNKKLKFNLRNNPFVCDCNTLWFRDWANRNIDRLLAYKYYVCNSPGALKHLHLMNFTLSWEYCENKHKESPIAIIGIIIATLSVIFVLAAILSYTKRWSIRHCIYQAIIKRRKYKKLVNDGHYKYDAFICYCSSDVKWVINKLLHVLEEENHFHLCLHDRDFSVGNDIVDNIVESMQQSYKVVLVLSSNFAQSNWCQFEASIAQQKILEEHQDNIVPILLNDIPANLQSKRLSILLKQKTYIEWPHEDKYEQMFWERLIKCLNGMIDYYEI